MMLVLINFLLPVNYDTCMRLSRYRVLKNSCNTVLDLSAQCFPYMEDSELSAFLIWKVQSSVPSLYGRFRAQCLPYMEGSELNAFLIWKVQSSEHKGSSYLLLQIPASCFIPLPPIYSLSPPLTPSPLPPPSSLGPGCPAPSPTA